VVTTAGMFVVLVMGALVTNTGSAQGCGRTWPLCRGLFIPQFAGATAIEFSHRAVVSVESLLVVSLTAGMVLLFWKRREAQILAPTMIVFLLLQAVLGGLAVMYPEDPPILALHFGISLISFASIALSAAFLWEVRGSEALRDRPLPRGLKGLVWGTLVYTYLVVYLGAYVRHTNASLACIDWPLCNGALVPPLSGALAVQFAHRVAAVAALLLVFALWLWSFRGRATRPDMHRASAAALVLIVLQALSGAVVIYSRLDLFSTLLHSALVTLLFGCLCYLAMHTLRRPAAARTVAAERALATSKGV
jgi:cytochrome c oxidase assembly protein subunit 15